MTCSSNPGHLGSAHSQQQTNDPQIDKPNHAQHGPMSENLRRADPIYPWQRFWVPREGSIDLSDGGFLRDPQSEFAQYSAYKLDTLSDLQHFRALALLGEPGIGKSSTLQAESTASEQQTQENGRVSIHVDLRSFSSDVLL